MSDINKLLVFLGRIDNLNENLFQTVHPYWQLQLEWGNLE